MLRLSSRSVRTSTSTTRVVSVRMLADAVVVEQAMAVAELDALGDEIHASHCNLLGMAASAVLFSGGLDSAVLLALERRDARARLADSRARRAGVGRRRSARDRPAAGGRAVRRPRQAGHDAAPSTCATSIRRRTGPSSGQPPAYDTPDEDVYLEGRNIVLVVEGRRAVRAARASSASRSARSPAIRFLTRRRSSSPRWRARCRSDSAGRSTSPRRSWPCTRRTSCGCGVDLGVPLELTLSCMNPQGDQHCGRCSKCRERQDAFRVAGVADQTDYAERWSG